MILAATLCIRRAAKERPQISLVSSLLTDIFFLLLSFTLCLFEPFFFFFAYQFLFGLQILKLLKGELEVTNWASQEVRASEEVDIVDGEVYLTNIESHLNLALIDMEDDSLSVTSNERSVQIED